MIWGAVVGWIVTTIISAAFAPKAKSPKPAGLGDINVPTAEEGREIPVLFGTREIKGVNTLWYGHLKTKKVKD